MKTFIRSSSILNGDCTDLQHLIYMVNVMKSSLANIGNYMIKRVVLVFALFAFIATPAVFAQGGGFQNMEERMKAQIDEVVKALALSEEKSVQVRGILEEESRERMTIFQGSQGQDRNARRMMREEMNELGDSDDLLFLK